MRFLHVATRRVVLSPATFHPDEAWIAVQAEIFVSQARGQGLRVRYLQHDRDGKFAPAFDRALKRRHIEVVRSPAHAPNCQAFVERFIGSIRRECLDHFIFLGLQHFDSVAATYLAHYLGERPHQGLGNELLPRANQRHNSGVCKKQADDPVLTLRDIRCEQRLGGLLKHYSR